MKILFDLASLYYWPQYFPVFQELTKRGHSCSLALHTDSVDAEVLRAFVETLPANIAYEVVAEKNLVRYFQKQAVDWIVFGNDNFDEFSSLPAQTKTALLYHGIGVKACYYSEGLSKFDVRFTEGSFRQQQLQNMFPDANFHEVGFAKLDPLFDPDYYQFEQMNLESIGLKSGRPTLLYAPTFYPSSIERMPKDWPAKFSDCNIIIKPHFFTWSNSKYQKQRDLLKHWQGFDNVYLAPAKSVSLLPYMDKADLLISEASSALFEFAALDKPVLWLDFLQLRWGYRGIFSYRFKRRMDTTIDPYRDVALHVQKPKDLDAAVRSQLQRASEFKAKRERTTTELIGQVDGKVSQRIADYLEQHK